MVVDDVGEVISGKTVRFHYDRITFICSNVISDGTVYQIIETFKSWIQLEFNEINQIFTHGPDKLYFEPNTVWDTLRQFICNLCRV
jgi:hypothetical protein